VDVPVRLAREGVPEASLSAEVLTEVLRAVAAGIAAKEAVPDILKVVGMQRLSVREAIERLGLKAADEAKIRLVVDTLVERESALVAEKGEAAFSPLMGEAMKELRGKADGATVGRMLKERLARASGSAD
jgi:glutamyl-tRNA(Gln) amidotransferase subunit E